MSAKLYLRAAARRDLAEHFGYLAEHTDMATAEKFLSHAEESFDALSVQPLLGTTLQLRHPDLDGVRKWHVKNFENILIFYLPRADGLSIVRVLHAARDWSSLLT